MIDLPAYLHMCESVEEFDSGVPCLFSISTVTTITSLPEQALQAQLERAESEKSTLAAESGNKIKQALSLLDTARKVCKT